MSRYIVVDFETYPIEGKSFIMEIGCVEVVDGTLGKEWSSLIRPVIPVSDFVLNLTGMSQSVLDEAPEFLDVLSDFYGFVANSVVVAHNANIDRLSFDNTCVHFNQEPRTLLWVDSQDVVKMMDPTIHTIQLQSLLKHYQLSTDTSHRALSDAYGLAQLMLYYTKERTLVLTKKEVLFLKQSPLGSIITLIKFVLQFFSVNVYDEAPVVDRPILNSKHSDNNIKGISHSTHYTNTDNTILDAIRQNHCEHPVVLVTNKKTFLECMYVSAASKFVFPDKIYRLYPLITDIKVSHIELVEIYAIMNWLRKTRTYSLSELNDQMVQRYYQRLEGVLDTHPLSLVNFIKEKINLGLEQASIVECDCESFHLLVSYAPEMLSGFHIVLYHFFDTNHRFSHLNTQELSFRYFKQLSSTMMHLALIIEYLRYLNVENINYIQDVARLKSFVQMIDEEKHQLFQHATTLMQSLSVNIYDFDQRQVLVNHYVQETVEWQQIQGALNVISHYIEEMLKVFQKISYYIYPELNTWFSDLIYMFSKMKQYLATFLTDNIDTVLYLESPISSKPSNVRIMMKHTFQHHMYNTIMQYASNMSTHQSYYQPFLDPYMALLLGVPEFNSGKKDTGNDPNVTVLFCATQDMIKTVKKVSDLQPYIIVVNTKKRARFWKQQLRQTLFRGVLKGAEKKNMVVTLNKLKDMPSAEGAHLIFPEFLNLNTMQPLHQHRIQSKGLDEARYINHIFNARVSSMQHQLAHLDGASLTFNVEPSLKPLVQFNR